MNKVESKVSFHDLYGIIAETLDREGAVSFTANGSSMLPFIRGGIDQVTIEKIPNQIRKNDVVFYRRGDGSFVLHRIVSYKNGAFVLCGDNQYALEKGVARENMIGILKDVSKNGSSVDLSSLRYKLYLFHLPLRRFHLRIKQYLLVILHRLLIKTQ